MPVINISASRWSYQFDGLISHSKQIYVRLSLFSLSKQTVIDSIQNAKSAHLYLPFVALCATKCRAAAMKVSFTLADLLY